MSAESDFSEKVANLIRQARALNPASRKLVMELLAETRKRVIAEIAGIDPSSFQAAQLRTLAREINAAMEQFGAQLSAGIGSLQAESFRLGEAVIDAPLSSAGLPTPSFAGISQSALAIAQGYTADLVKGLAADSAAKLNAAIQRAFLGGQSLGDIIGQVGKALANGQGFTGLFSPIGDRAATIAINEILRVHSIAAQARMEDLQDTLPMLKKEWLHIPVARIPRITHIDASGQVQNVGEPFDVGGEDLMYPRDPNGSPENTINCHCLVRPFLDRGALIPTGADKKLLKDLGISVSAG